MSITRVTFTLLLCSLALAGPAQAQTAPADTARYYKHHLGLTASPVLDHFFTANRSLPVGLLYKRQTAPNKLWRFGLVLNQDYSRRDEYRPDLSYVVGLVKSNDEFVSNNFGVSTSLGREFTHRFSPNWIGVIGADISVGFSRFVRETRYQRPGDAAVNLPPLEYSQVVRQRYYRAAITPFIGLRYAIWPSMYASAESAVNLTYTRDVFDSYGKATSLTTGDLVYGTNSFDGQTRTDQSLALRYRFINQLTLHYQFGR